MPSVAVVYHSGFGHTAAQARAVCEGALDVACVSSRMVFCEEATEDPGVLADSDAIVLGCPTYMGSASASFKAFMDATSGIWLAQHWKDKLAAGFTNSGGHSGDKLSTLLQLMVFAMQHGMVWVGLGLPDGGNASDSSHDNLNRLGAYAGAMAQSNVDQGLDGMLESDLATARALGRRVAEATLRWDSSGEARE
ncbi:MAG TPA: flavodoxin family protein [Gaiellaceae bacterium]|nr:flavodoxin family protein [Gaiellaceae bacterium]